MGLIVVHVGLRLCGQEFVGLDVAVYCRQACEALDRLSGRSPLSGTSSTALVRPTPWCCRREERCHRQLRQRRTRGFCSALRIKRCVLVILPCALALINECCMTCFCDSVSSWLLGCTQMSTLQVAQRYSQLDHNTTRANLLEPCIKNISTL